MQSSPGPCSTGARSPPGPGWSTESVGTVFPGPGSSWQSDHSSEQIRESQGRALGGQNPDDQTIGIMQEGWCEGALASVLS